MALYNFHLVAQDIEAFDFRTGYQIVSQKQIKKFGDIKNTKKEGMQKIQALKMLDPLGILTFLYAQSKKAEL